MPKRYKSERRKDWGKGPRGWDFPHVAARAFGIATRAEDLEKVPMGELNRDHISYPYMATSMFLRLLDGVELGHVADEVQEKLGWEDTQELPRYFVDRSLTLPEELSAPGVQIVAKFVRASADRVAHYAGERDVDHVKKGIAATAENLAELFAAFGAWDEEAAMHHATKRIDEEWAVAE